LVLRRFANFVNFKDIRLAKVELDKKNEGLDVEAFILFIGVSPSIDFHS